MSWRTHFAIQVALFAIQYLAPAFANLDTKQEEATASFVSAVQMALAVYNHYQNKDNGSDSQGKKPSAENS